MSTSRIHRKLHRALQFVEEEIVSYGMRAVFIAQGIDTDAKEDWELRLSLHGMMDGAQRRAYVDHIHAAHGGQLKKGEIYGTIPHGYRGAPMEGVQTRRGRPQRKIAIDPTTSRWVIQIFSWYVDDRLSVPEIVRRLNEGQVPPPERSVKDRWTESVIRRMLRNRRYLGYWAYGEQESKYLAGPDYIRQFKRDKPLYTEHFDYLRLIDDVVFAKAQALLAEQRRHVGRRPKSSKGKRIRLLNGLLHCAYHDRRLVTGGGQGAKWICPDCQATDKKLFSYPDRALVREIVLNRIGEIICDDPLMAEQIVEACREAVRRKQEPDPEEQQTLDRQIRKLTEQIGFIFDNLGETETDRKESNGRLNTLRQQRTAVENRQAELKALMSAPAKVPTATQVRNELKQLQTVLVEAVSSDDPSMHAKVRGILDLVINGKIEVSQVGPRKPGQGWARGKFIVNVPKLIGREYGLAVGDEGAASVEIEFRRPPVHEQIAEQVKTLFDQGLKYTEIAEKVGWNRNIVARALAHWHENRSLPAPDGRTLVKRLSGPRLAERIADQVMAMVHQDVPLTAIAEQLGTSRNRITEAIKVYHQKRNLPVPDGRTLRKERNARRRQQRRAA